jgi:hypothetical protein
MLQPALAEVAKPATIDRANSIADTVLIVFSSKL